MAWATNMMNVMGHHATPTASRAGGSNTRQAIQLGYLPRMTVLHTSASEIGQIYIPRINWLLMAGVLALVVALVLLVTTLNAAGLMVARNAARTRELAVRTALGARGGRLARQLLVESSLLAVLGGAAGIVAAMAMLGGIRRWAPSVFPRLAEVQLDARALAFVLGVVAVVAVILGLLPARSALRTGLAGALRHGTAGSGEGRSSTRLRGALVVVQVALAVVVAVSAGPGMKQ